MAVKDPAEPTIASWLSESTAKLKSADIASARLDCLLLLEDVLQKDRSWILAHDIANIGTIDLLELNTKIVQRASRIPLAYIRNQQEFYGRSFYVDEHVLIPRPESEAIITLLRELMNSSKWIANNQTVDQPTTHPPELTLLDIGTGSGCLAITAKLEIPTANVLATDISSDALKVAGGNAETYQADIQFIEADLFSIPHSPLITVVIANLPYVPEKLITSAEITKEPALALFSGEDGMNHYQRLWQQLSVAEHAPRYVITESLEQQHQQMAHRATLAGYQLIKTDTLAQLFAIASGK